MNGYMRLYPPCPPAFPPLLIVEVAVAPDDVGAARSVVDVDVDLGLDLVVHACRLRCLEARVCKGGRLGGWVSARTDESLCKLRDVRVWCVKPSAIAGGFYRSRYKNSEQSTACLLLPASLSPVGLCFVRPLFYYQQHFNGRILHRWADADEE